MLYILWNYSSAKINIVLILSGPFRNMKYLYGLELDACQIQIHNFMEMCRIFHYECSKACWTKSIENESIDMLNSRLWWFDVNKCKCLVAIRANCLKISFSYFKHGQIGYLCFPWRRWITTAHMIGTDGWRNDSWL